MKSVSLSEFRQIAPKLPHAEHSHGAGGAAGASTGGAGVAVGDAGYQNNYAPMFLPVDAGEKKNAGVIKVVTRQKFLDENIDHWVKWHFYRSGMVVCGIGALALLPVNVVFSGAAAIGAGYCYGQFKRKDFIVNQLLKHRWMLEGT